MKRIFLILAALLSLAACTGLPDQPSETAPGVAKRGAWSGTGPASLTLVTVRRNDGGAGAHTALVINGSEQVIFDPAGSFRHPEIARQGDVLVGMDPAFVRAFVEMHARSTHNVLTQTVTVPPEVAEQALQLAYARGRVGKAFCANSTSALLKQLPGFEDMRITFWPVELSERFTKVTGVAGTVLYEDFTPPADLGAETLLAAS